MNDKLLKRLSGIAIIILTTLMGFQTLRADVPSTPRDFAGESYGKNYIVFQWGYDADSINFNLYKAKGKTDDLTKFTKVEMDPQLLSYENGMYFLFYEEKDSGVNSYYITAVNDQGESKNSNIVSIEPYKEQDMIWFSNAPQITNIKKGETFKFDFDAETNVDSANIVYSIVNEESDKGGKIDINTGEFEFTASESGSYHFSILAELKDHPHVSTKLYFELHINKCDVGGTISGTVTDEDNNPIAIGEVYLISAKDGWENKNPTPYTEITNGSYKFDNVDEGEYYLYFTAYGDNRDSTAMYMPEYYNNAQDIHDAEKIKVECATDYTYSAQLTKQDFKQYKLEITSEPPKYAKIGDDISYQVTYKTDLENPVPQFSMYTNAEGAKIDESTGLLTWKADKNGIYYFTINVSLKDKYTQPAEQEFSISVRECEVGATISGKVTDTKGDLVKYGMATLYSATSNDPKFGGITLQTEIKDGAYKFENIDKGDYYLYFDGGLLERKEQHDSVMVYMSQWYDNTTNPEEAKVISINCGDTFTADVIFKENPYNKYKINIVSQPNTTIKLGDTWTYQIKAETDIENPEFVYILSCPVVGPTIDQTTGIVTWTPTENGTYQFSVGVYTKEYGQEFAAYQTITLKVTECDVSPKINITVKDQNGDYIPNVLVYVLQVAEKDNQKYGFNVVSYGILANGQGTIEGLDKGSYYIYAQAYTNDSTYEAANYYPWWYDAKYDYDKADILDLNCGDSKDINVVMEKMPVPTMYNVSGSVLDNITKDPIANASVVFMGTEKNTKMINYFDSMTDEHGAYTISLPDNYDYIAYSAIYRFKDGGNWQDMYVPQYYNGVTDPTEATTITLTADINNINFQLSKIATYNNSLTGTLTGEDAAVIDKGFVVAYLVECANKDEEFMLYSGISCEVNSDGKFLLENLIPGKYVIYGSPDYAKTYAPGFYKENAVATINWEEATHVTVTAEGESGSYKVVLPFKDKGLAGNGKIHGSVSKGHKMKISDDLTSTDPVNGANMYLIDSDGNIVNYINTDVNGSFAMDNLGYGEYLLVADKVGLSNNSQLITIKEGSNDVSKAIELTDNTTVVEDTNISGNKVYPNPAKTQTTIEYIGTSGNTEITIINSIGDEVKTIKTTSITGNNTLSIDISSFTAGSYFIRISNNGNTEILPIIINK